MARAPSNDTAIDTTSPSTGAAGRSLATLIRSVRQTCAGYGLPTMPASNHEGAQPLALPHGQWTLRDCFRNAGRQFVIVHLSATTPRLGIRGLSERELAVVRDVARGEALKVVASTWAISVQAVSTYLGRAKRKLGVSTRADLARSILGDQPPASSMSESADFRIHAQLHIDGEWFRILVGPPRSPDSTINLTPTEGEILSDILQGLRTADIARLRRTSLRTVQAHVGSLMRKLNARSRGELVAAVLGLSALAATRPRPPL